MLTKNYYCSVNNNQYDLVFAVRTIQLKENNNFTFCEKVYKLMSNVKKGGYLYLMYYLNNDIEVANKQMELSKDIVKKKFEYKNYLYKKKFLKCWITHYQ